MIVNGFTLIVLVSTILLLLTILVSIVSPTKRVWPPPSRASWKYWFVWALSSTTGIGLLGSVVSDWSSNNWPLVIRLLGGAIAVGGGVLAIAAIRELGMRRTQGLGGSLVKNGPYKYSRNPQYVGDCLLVIGLAIASSSLSTLCVSVLIAVCLLLTPLAEEPWLSDKIGKSYLNYLSEVSRYFGRKRPISSP